MANNPQQPNPFMPSFEGPFESTIEQGLRPPSPLTVQNPQANVSKLAAAAGLTSKLLEGIQQGAMRKYVQTERVKQTQRDSVYAQLASIKNNDQISQEHKAQLEQMVNGAMMGYTAQQIEDAHKANQDETGGKKGKSKQPEKPIDHVRNFLVTGLRKASGVPEGSKPIDLNGLNTLMASTFDKDGNVKPEYSAAKKQGDLEAKIQAATQGAVSQTDFYNKIGPLIPEIQRVHGQGARDYVAERANGFPQLNPAQEQLTRDRNNPPGSSNVGQPPPGSRNSPLGPLGKMNIAPGPPGSAQAPPSAGESPMTPEMRSAMLYATEGFPLGQPRMMLLPDGTKVMARPYANPEGVGYLDDSGKKLPAGSLDAAESQKLKDQESAIKKREDDAQSKVDAAERAWASLNETKKRDAETSVLHREQMDVARERLGIERDKLADAKRKIGESAGRQIRKQFESLTTTLVTRQNSEVTRIRSSQSMSKATQDAEIQRSNEAFEKQKREIAAQERQQLGDISKEYGVTFDQAGEPQGDKASDVLKSLFGPPK